MIIKAMCIHRPTQYKKKYAPADFAAAVFGGGGPSEADISIDLPQRALMSCQKHSDQPCGSGLLGIFISSALDPGLAWPMMHLLPGNPVAPFFSRECLV
jgi:hypothetical protein